VVQAHQGNGYPQHAARPWTLAEVKQITNFEKTKCGIKFS
jgi:hypothetical protein